MTVMGNLTLQVHKSKCEMLCQLKCQCHTVIMPIAQSGETFLHLHNKDTSLLLTLHYFGRLALSQPLEFLKKL